MQELRHRGIAAELYHEVSKFDKQFKYAEKKHIPFAIIIGEQELQSQTLVIRDLAKREQQTLGLEEFRSRARELFSV